jgi:uncharacterized membrane protein
VPPAEKIRASLLRKKFDAFIFSDFSRANLQKEAEQRIADQVREGSGLLMVGGWGSFSGPFGKWKGSEIEALLPVSCALSDDRVNLASGLIVRRVRDHQILSGLSWKEPPVLIGLNRVTPKRGAEVLLSAAPLVSKGSKISLSPRAYPLLVVDRDHRRAALTTDLAPHWCGGWVDWGRKRKYFPVTPDFGVEVGFLYARFVGSLLRWLARA